MATELGDKLDEIKQKYQSIVRGLRVEIIVKLTIKKD
jgi:hypothetical protein